MTNSSQVVTFFTFSEQRRRIPVSAHAHQHLLWSVFLKIAIQMGVLVSKLHFPNDKLYWTSFHVLLAICTFSLGKYLSKSFAYFFLLFVLLLSCKSFSICCAYKSFISFMICKYFSPSLWFIFAFPYRCLLEHTFLILIMFNLSFFIYHFFPFTDYTFSIISKKSNPRSQSCSLICIKIIEFHSFIKYQESSGDFPWQSSG